MNTSVIRHCRAAATSFVIAAAAGFASAAEPAPMAGAKAVIAAALRAEPKPAAEPNAYDRFLLAVRALGDRQIESRGAVAPDAWLAAVDLALAVEPDAARTIPLADGPADGNTVAPSVRSRLVALLSVLPGPEGWDAVRAGLRERAAKLAAEPAPAAAPAAAGRETENAKKKPDPRPVLLAALQAAADFLGEGGRGAPASLAALSALPLPEGLASNRVEKAVAALRRAMDDPGVPKRAPFSAERLLRRIDRTRLNPSATLVLPKEIADLPDEAFAPIAERLFAPAADGDAESWPEYVATWDLPSNGVARLAAAAAETTNAGPFAWTLLQRMEPGPDARALHDSLVAAQDPLAAIRKRIDQGRAARAARAGADDEAFEDDDFDAEPLAGAGDGNEAAENFSAFFSWEDQTTAMYRYATTLRSLVSRALDDGRLADAEAFAAPLSADDWAAVLALVRKFGERFRPARPTEAWRAFLEARLPAGEALLRSPFLPLYAEVCRPDKAARFEATCARLLGEAAAGDKATKALKGYRLAFARAAGDLDALEADFLERTDPSSKARSTDSDARDWCRALEALGDTNRLARALDRVLAFAAAKTPGDLRPREAPVWAVPILARAGRFGDAEGVARAAMAEDANERRGGSPVWRSSSSGGSPATELLRAYLAAGRPADALDLAAGWPYWGGASIHAGECSGKHRESRAAAVAAALALVGGETNRAAAAQIARVAIGEFGTGGDWPFEVLLETMPGEAFRALADDLVKLDPYEERPWQWKAESLRRAGDLAGAEAAARRALEIDPTDGEAAAGDRIRSYAILASVLDAKGGAADRAEAATLRRVVAAVRAAEKGDELTDLGYLAGAIGRYDEAADLFADAYCVQWRLAERLRATGREAEAVAHYEETFRHMPAQFGQVASLCFGCEGVFSSPESSGAAERILPALAAAPGAGASVHNLLGMLREHQGRYDEAFEAFSLALEADPGHFDALTSLLGLRESVERPAAEWARLQALARRLDPFVRHHYEAPERIVDWPGLWRAWAAAAAGAPAPWKAPEGPLFRFEAAARIEEAGKAARRAAEDAVASEAGVEREPPPPNGGGHGPWATGGAFTAYLPARMLVRKNDGGRFWASRLVDLAAALAADAPREPSLSATHYSYGDYGASDAWSLAAGSPRSDDAFGSDDDYFWDE